MKQERFVEIAETFMNTGKNSSNSSTESKRNQGALRLATQIF